MTLESGGSPFDHARGEGLTVQIQTSKSRGPDTKKRQPGWRAAACELRESTNYGASVKNHFWFSTPT